MVLDYIINAIYPTAESEAITLLAQEISQAVKSALVSETTIVSDLIEVSIIASGTQVDGFVLVDTGFGETAGGSSGPIDEQQAESFSLSDIISASGVLESIVQVGLTIADLLFGKGEDYFDLHVRKPDGCGGWVIMTYRVKKRDYFP